MDEINRKYYKINEYNELLNNKIYKLIDYFKPINFIYINKDWCGEPYITHNSINYTIDLQKNIPFKFKKDK